MHTFIPLDLLCWRTGTVYGKLKAEQLSTTINHGGSDGNYTNCGCSGPFDWTDNHKERKKNRDWMFIVDPFLTFVLSSLNFSKVSLLPALSWTLFSQAEKALQKKRKVECAILISLCWESIQHGRPFACHTPVIIPSCLSSCPWEDSVNLCLPFFYPIEKGGKKGTREGRKEGIEEGKKGKK